MDTEHYRSLLQARRTELQAVQDTGRRASGTVALDQTRQGRLSRMDAMQQQAMSVATARRRDLELARIAAALRRIDAGEYGDCLRCGEPLAAARLAIDPTCTLCVPCAERAESTAGPA